MAATETTDDWQGLILRAHRDNQVTVLAGGVEMSTHIPKLIMQNDNPDGLRKDQRRILCTHPRGQDIAIIAERVAADLDVSLGEEVGFEHEREEKSSDKTILMFMADALAVLELMEGDAHEKYSTTIVFEAHERTVNTDLVLAMLKNIYGKHKSLKVVIMATPSTAQTFMDYFTHEDNLPPVETPNAQHMPSEQPGPAVDPPSAAISSNAAVKPESPEPAKDEHPDFEVNSYKPPPHNKPKPLPSLD